MRWIQILTQAPVVARLGWTILHSLWEVASLALLLAVLQPVLRAKGSRTEYAASAVTLVLMAILPVISFAWLGISPTQGSRGRSDVPATAIVESAGAPVGRPGVEQGRSGLFTANTGITGRGEGGVAILGWLVLAWTVGVACLSAWNFGGWIGVQRLKRIGVVPVEGGLERIASELAARLGVRRSFRLLRSALVRSPTVIGLLKPLILLPASLVTELPVDQLESLLAHELAHIRRHDYAVNLAQVVVETLMFYHPAVWWVSGRMRVLRENCCDDLVVSVTPDRTAYVKALAAVAGISASHLAPAANGGLLISRLKRLMGARPSECRWSGGGVFAGAIVALALMVAIAIGAGPSARGASTGSEEEMAVVRGHVVDPDGTPVVGADVSVNGFRWSKTVVARTKSTAGGAFQISYRKSNFDGGEQYRWEDATIVAAAPGFGPVVTTWKEAQKGNVEMKLVADDVPIQGRVLDVEGRPVAGAHVSVDSLQSGMVRLDKMDAAGQMAGVSYENWYIVPGFAPGVARDVVTGADGRFELRGMGSDRTVDLVIQGPGMAWGQARVLTHPGPKMTKKVYDIRPRTFTVYGSEFEYTAQPGLSVEGMVLDALTGKPLAGVRVESEGLAVDTYFGGQGALGTVTDANGHYRLDGFPPGRGNGIVALPSEDQPYFMRAAHLPNVKAPGLTTIDFRLHRGVWITGKVTDKGTGKPVAAAVNYNPYRWNQYATAIPEINQGDLISIGWPRQDFYVSNADGSYRVVGLPGPAMVGASCFSGGYRHGVGQDSLPKAKEIDKGRPPTYFGWGPELTNVVKAVDIRPGVEETHLDFELDSGVTVKIVPTDANDQPMAGVQVYEQNGLSTMKGEAYESRAYGPDERRTIAFCDDEKKVGKVAVVGPDEIKAGTVRVKLEPLAKVRGRLLDLRGKPAGDVRVDPSTTSPEDLFEFRTTTTDADGRFEFTAPAGCKYWIAFQKGNECSTDLKDFKVTAGETTDLGDVRITEQH